LAEAFRSQCVLLGVDSIATNGEYRVKQYTGSPDATIDSGRRTLHWVREAAELGAGEIVLNCMDADGTRAGYDIAHLNEVIAAVSVPVIASGGAGEPAHFRDLFLTTGATGALAATVFHDRLISI